MSRRRILTLLLHFVTLMTKMQAVACSNKHLNESSYFTQVKRYRIPGKYLCILQVDRTKPGGEIQGTHRRGTRPIQRMGDVGDGVVAPRRHPQLSISSIAPCAYSKRGRAHTLHARISPYDGPLQKHRQETPHAIINYSSTNISRTQPSTSATKERVTTQYIFAGEVLTLS